MTERDRRNRFFAIVPTHDGKIIVEGDSLSELPKGIDQVLKNYEMAFPFHNFREGIVVIKGTKVPFSPKKKIKD